MSDKIKQLEKLGELLTKGEISDKEFQERKSQILDKVGKEDIFTGMILYLEKDGRYVKAFDKKGRDFTSLVSSKRRQKAHKDGKLLKASVNEYSITWSLTTKESEPDIKIRKYYQKKEKWPQKKTGIIGNALKWYVGKKLGMIAEMGIPQDLKELSADTDKKIKKAKKSIDRAKRSWEEVGHSNIKYDTQKLWKEHFLTEIPVFLKKKRGQLFSVPKLSKSLPRTGHKETPTYATQILRKILKELKRNGDILSQKKGRTFYYYVDEDARVKREKSKHKAKTKKKKLQEASPKIKPIQNNKIDIEKELKKYKRLLDQELITQDDYDLKKKEILGL